MSQPIYLVTGAHGFIGAWVVKRLLAEDAGVVIFDRSADPQRLQLIMDEDEIARPLFIEGDITDVNFLSQTVERHRVTKIIHLAGLQVPACRSDPRLGALVNVVGTINIFEAAKKSGGRVTKVVYASSAAVFGAEEQMGHPGQSGESGESEQRRAAVESDAGGMNTHYGAFKRCNEDNARIFFLDDGLSSIGLRPLTVYGVGRDTGMTSDPTKAMKAACLGRPFPIRFGGRTDFLYVADCADAFILAAKSDLQGAHVFNLHGETVHMADVVREIEKIIPAAKGTITFIDTPLAIPAELDDAAIVQALGGVPHTSLARGVRETIDRFRQLQKEGRLDASDLDI
jgi:nucleoside-diphosphate-sugar epimerase